MSARNQNLRNAMPKQRNVITNEQYDPKTAYPHREYFK